VPPQFKTAISVGIGLFIAVIGLVDAGFVRKSFGGPLGELGVGGFLAGWPLLVFVVGLFLDHRRLTGAPVKGAILYGIIATTPGDHRGGDRQDRPAEGCDGTLVNPTGWGLNVPALPDGRATPTSAARVTSTCSARSRRSAFVSAVLLIFTLMLADFFDTMGTMVAIGAEGGLLDEEGNPPNSSASSIVDSVAAMAGGRGVSSNTSYIESASGVGEGRAHRSGLDRHRLALPAGDLLRAARRDGPLRGGHPALVSSASS
jgi:AGZA family xanthine/uracil permease-like MFS transporter